MNIETVAASFARYRARVLPRDAPAVQVEECRRAFYAGAYVLLMNLAYNIGDDATSEEDGITELEKLKAEIEAFAAAGGVVLTPAAQMHYTAPDPDEIRPILQELGRGIGEALPTGYGFSLLIFTYGAGGNLFYISSATREDVIATMREFINRQTQ